MEPAYRSIWNVFVVWWTAVCLLVATTASAAGTQPTAAPSSPPSSRAEPPETRDGSTPVAPAAGAGVDPGSPDAAAPSEPVGPETTEEDAMSPEREQAAKLFREGTEFYELGNYKQAIDRFQAAWELEQEPRLLYNVGQSYWKWYDVEPQLDHLRQARLFFTNYDKRMRLQPGYSPTEIDGLLRAINAQIEAEERQQAERERPIVVDPALAEREAAERRRLERERQLRITKGLRISGIVSIVAGSVALVLGLSGIIVRQSNKLILDNTTGSDSPAATTVTHEQDKKRRDNYLVGGQLAFAGFLTGGILLPIGIGFHVTATIREKQALKKRGQDQRAQVRLHAGPLLFVRF